MSRSMFDIVPSRYQHRRALCFEMNMWTTAEDVTPYLRAIGGLEGGQTTESFEPQRRIVSLGNGKALSAC